MLLQRCKCGRTPLATLAVFIVASLSWAQPARAALDATQVAILVNKDAGISSQVARMYQHLRGVPEANILRLPLGTSRHITAAEYWKAAAPVRAFLEAHPEIRCVLTTSGVPYTVQLNETTGIAFDNELAGVLRLEPNDTHTGLPNPLFLDGQNPYGINDPRRLKMVYVARLDGPDLATLRRMVEDAIAVEQTGLQGPVFGDAQGIDGITGYGLGDASIRQAMDRLSGAGFEAKLDLNQATWMQPKDGVGNEAAAAAFYIGWYSLRTFQDIFGAQGLARGAIAWHIASQEAENIWDANERGWCVNLMRRGAAVTLGPVREPYVQAFPRGDIFVEALLSGASVAESYWLSLPNISWAMVILGDPLYRPFAAHPQPALVARAYVADNPSHILQSGETSPLLVEVECVGPAGSSTPALTAVAEPETGLAAAAGMVNIPALHAGQMTIVRVPRVTAGNDSSGDLFRLRLKVQEEGERTRRIVLEGRIGFSRLTWGLSPKGQMFPAPGGERLIAGEPGFSALIATDTLHTQMIATPKDTVVGTAVFSFDGSHVALGLVDPAKKAEAVAIVNSQLGSPQYLAAGSHFIRWLDKDRFLLEDQNRLVSRSVLGGPDRAFEVPDGWSSTIIPGTEVQILSKPGGKLAVRNGAGPLREVLTGVVLKKSVAVANDLTVFGAVDDQQRFWVQRGLDAAPAVVAEGVEQVIWGPISHLAVVRQANGKSRVYDGRDNSWLDLGAVSEAQWSPDEQRLLFVQPASGGEPGTLRLLAGRQVRTLYDLKKIGPVAHIAFASHDRVFLQAAPTGEAGVWMMALPPRPAEAN